MDNNNFNKVFLDSSKEEVLDSSEEMFEVHKKYIEYWTKDEQPHREDGPAIITRDGSKKWYIDGKLHRENGPAIEWSSGKVEWHINGELHNKYGPAIETIDGDQEWYVNGKLHRTDGPAIIYKTGHKEWWLEGKLHREDGPAIIYDNGETKYFKCGEEYSPGLSEKLSYLFKSKITEEREEPIASVMSNQNNHKRKNKIN